MHKILRVCQSFHSMYGNLRTGKQEGNGLKFIGSGGAVDFVSANLGD